MSRVGIVLSLIGALSCAACDSEAENAFERRMDERRVRLEERYGHREQQVADDSEVQLGEIDQRIEQLRMRREAELEEELARERVRMEDQIERRRDQRLESLAAEREQRLDALSEDRQRGEDRIEDGLAPD
ncbi:hypothetical protein [Sandaracinus amylolyticus]|uniref:hypothetical protein n=1 Tax=Sandaracinus amylolyticus TaxID=927083 RepID=UPI001F2E4836|nr:hypothetical protein [Sandaracinus amylolyticus]UJR81947.1 Hypothetical protein I5071_40120 [Sandaracinus amylolyticus]